MNTESTTSIVIELIKFFGGVIGAWFVYYKSTKSLTKKIGPLVKTHPLVKTNLAISLRSFSMISALLQTMFERSSADRFVILAAHNGKNPLRYATAFYEQHNQDGAPDSLLSIGAVSKYVKFEFDRHYRETLEDVETLGHVVLDVSKMPSGDLKSIYLVEKIKHSVIYFLLRAKEHDLDGNDLLIYCSVASHKDAPFTEEEKIIFKYHVTQIKELLGQTFQTF